MPITVPQAESAATGAGVLTLVVGAVLAVAPDASARAVGLPTREHRTGLRAVGVTDLVIAAGLVAGRPRWPWPAMRAAANPPTVAYLAVLARQHRATALWPAAAFIAAATVGDVLAFRALRAADR